MAEELRFVKISELDFLTCVHHNVFGRDTAFLKEWKAGDKIAFIINEDIAGIATVTGSMFGSEDRLWLKNLNKYRLDIIFSHAFCKGTRPSFSPHKEILKNMFGDYWGNVFVLRKSLPEKFISSLLSYVDNFESDHQRLKDDIHIKIHEEIQKEHELMVERYDEVKKRTSPEENEDSERFKDLLVLRMVEFIRNDPTRFDKINKESFAKTLSSEERDALKEIPYAEVKESVFHKLRSQGLYRKLFPSYGAGTYVVVGDMHGDHTTKEMVNLVNNLSSTIGADRVFHIGHLSDDNGIINENIFKIKNFTVVSRIEEAYAIEKFIEREGKVVDVVRDGVFLGTIPVINQDCQTDYMTARPSSVVMRKKPFLKTTIFSHHTHQFDVSATQDEERVITAFPGCLCEKHVESRRKNLAYEDGVLESYLSRPQYGSRPHRRKWAVKEGWEQGVLVVHVNKDLSYSIIPCRIKKVRVNNVEQYATSYFDKIILEKTVCSPDTKLLMNADIHVPLYDSCVLNIQDNVAKDYAPDIYVNLGDTRCSDGLSHHKMAKHEVVTDKIVDEGKALYHVLKQMSKWAPKKYLLFGNHERFARDFTNVYPQFKGLVDFEVMSNYKSLGYELIDHQLPLEIGDVAFVHGDLMRSSNPLDSLSSAFIDKTVVMGHYHTPGVRKGAYIIGYSGQRDQHYNDKTVTKWCHGFGLCNYFAGQSWVTSIAIINNSVTLNGKTYSSNNESFWRNFNYKMEIKYTES